MGREGYYDPGRTVVTSEIESLSSPIPGHCIRLMHSPADDSYPCWPER